MQKLCTKCNHLGKEIGNSILLISAIILISISFLSIRTFYESSIIHAFGSVVWFAFGFYALYDYLYHPNICPNCKSKRTMIPLDTPKAQALINEHNLTIPEEAQQQPTSPKTSQ